MVFPLSGFNPRARRGRDTPIFGFALIQQSFQSTRPQGARRADWCFIIGVMKRFQSTRPQGARLRISGLQQTAKTGFNPRARRGRDPKRTIITRTIVLFQSTRPQGARLSALCIERNISAVSIHAPAGGATRHHAQSFDGEDCFNPRARRGRDFSLEQIQNALQWFQSTRPQGARQKLNQKAR